jgi:hypothetical protein
MTKQRVVSSNYLAVGLAIATGVAANLGLSLQAQAQVSPNIQTQLNILLPPISAQMPTGGGAAGPDQAFFQMKTASGQIISGCAPTEKLRSFAATLRSFNSLSDKNVRSLTVQEIAHTLTEQEIKQTVEGYFNGRQANITEEQKKLAEKSLPPVKPKPCVTRQPVNVQVSFPFNPTYETNILKSGNNGIPGESAGFGGNMLVTAGVEGRPWDIVVFSGGEASARYTPNFSPSVDGLSSQASYQLFLHAYGYNVSNVGDTWHKTFVDNLVPGSPNMPLPGMMTFDTLAFGVQNQTAFAPTFRFEKSDFLTPQVTIARQNIGLDDLNAKPCKDLQSNLQYCTYASFSLTAGESFADVKTLQNANFAASATVGWNITPSWSITLPATATAKDYQDVVGGRRDVLLQVGPVLSYTSSTFPMCSFAAAQKSPIICSEESAKYTFSLPVTYYKNYSTISADAWSGLVIMPTLTIAFNYASN